MIVIDNGDAIRGIAEVASKLDFIVNGYVGTTATQLADGQLSNSEADLYASGANATVVTSITIVNTDSAARTFTLYLKPSGGTSRAISPVSLDLPASYSFYTDGQRAIVMSTGGAVVQTYSLHAASHTDGTDDIQDAAADDSTKGIATFEADDFDSSSGKIDLAVSVTRASTTDSGTATPTAHDLGIVGGEGIDTSASGATVTITGEAASTTNKGVVELATGAETNTGTSVVLAVTPDALDDWTGSAQIVTVGTVTSGTLSTGAVLADVTMTLGSDADGDTYYRTSNKLARIAKGTAGQVWTMNAGATAPEWAAAAGGATLTVSETEVFNDTSPTSWTDLDLSGTIGANAALVLLKIAGGGAGKTAAFRKNGDTDEFHLSTSTGSAAGIAFFDQWGTGHVVTLVATDTAGKIEWMTESAQTITIDIISYIK